MINNSPEMEKFLKEMREYRREYLAKTGVSITAYYDLRPDENGVVNPYFNEPVPQEVKNKVREVFTRNLKP